MNNENFFNLIKHAAREQQLEPMEPAKSYEEVTERIHQIGANQRAIQTAKIKLDGEIANIRLRYAKEAARHAAKIKQLRNSLPMWCNANRDALLTDNKKTVHLATGSITWRKNRDKVRVVDLKKAIQELEDTGLTQYIRQPPREIRKDIVIAIPDPVLAEDRIKNIKIIRGKEKLVITPIQTKVEEVI